MLVEENGKPSQAFAFTDMAVENQYSSGPSIVPVKSLGRHPIWVEKTSSGSMRSSAGCLYNAGCRYDYSAGAYDRHIQALYRDQ